MADCDEQRRAVKAVDMCKGLDCKRYDPEKDDWLHGRGEKKLYSRPGEGVKVFGCEACVFGERYGHTCSRGKRVDDVIVYFRAQGVEASC